MGAQPANEPGLEIRHVVPMTREEGQRRGRFTVTFGGGAASVDVATFNGGIVVRPPEE